MSELPDPGPPPPPPPAPEGGAAGSKEDGGESQKRGMGVNNKDVENQQNAETINNTFFGAKQKRPVRDLLQPLLGLSASVHPYRHPVHATIIEALEVHRIVVLTSDREAAFVAGHALANDGTFADWKKLGLFIATLEDKVRDDLDLVSVSDALVQEERRILVVEIGEQRTFLDTILHTPDGALANTCVLLQKKSCYVVIVVKESLLEDSDDEERISAYQRWPVSQLQYLIARSFPTQADELEERLRKTYEPWPAKCAERLPIYRRVASAQGPDAFMRFVEEREAAKATSGAAPAAELHMIAVGEVFKEESVLHKSTAFVAASFPEVSQRDFDSFVRLTLAGETIKTEEVRQAFRRDGMLVTVRDKKEEPCTGVWNREADRIFRDCGLRTVAGANGAWVVDFAEPQLRTAVRCHIHERHPWYLRRQCERLQQSRILFDGALSPAAVEGVVKLFVERAVADPAAFGTAWLSDLVRRMADGPGEDPSGRRLAMERLSILIREMADHNTLRSVIRQFFDDLLGAAEHDTLLDLLAEPSLRYARGVDPFVWMRRLLNEGTAQARERTRERLLYLARRAGPAIYEFLATISTWMPDPEDEPDSYSPSEQLALRFPFAYCDEMAPWVSDGAWPSDHPLFYALPSHPDEARQTVSALMAWLIGIRGTTQAPADLSNPLKTPETARFEEVADLLEHFAWILEGGSLASPPPEGQALLTLLLEELDARLSARERTWLQRAWQRRQDALLAAAATHTGSNRKLLVARKGKLDQLRARFATVTAAAQKLHVQGGPKP